MKKEKEIILSDEEEKELKEMKARELAEGHEIKN